MKFIRQSLNVIAVPIIHVTDILKKPFDGVLSIFASKRKLQSDLESLEEQNERLTISLEEKDFIERENERLREILSHTENAVDLVTAKVLIRPPYSPYDTLTIDGGREDNLKEGNLVYSNGVRIGTIVDVSNNSSIVKLLSSSGEVTGVLLPDDIPAEAVGVGGGRFEIVLAKDLPVSIGDAVYINDQYAPVFGIIQGIEKDETSTFQIIHFNLPINLSVIQRVQILDPVASSPIIEEEIE